MKRNLKWLFFLVAIVIIIIARENTHLIRLNEGTKDFGFWSVVPALLTLTLCFVTKEVVTSLFLGIVAGGLISGEYNIVQKFLIPGIGSKAYGEILLIYLWCLGGLTGLWTKTGGAQYFANWVGVRVVKGRRSAKLFSAIMGTVFHQGGTISTVLAGSTVKPLSDRNKVSHEELSYIIDSTASPVATLLPFNVWPIYVAGLVAATIPTILPDEGAAISFFYRAVPYNFYAIVAIVFTYSLSLERLPWYGKRMKNAMIRVQQTGKLDRGLSTPLSSKELTELKVPGGYKPSNIDFLLPILTLLSITIIPFLVQVIPQLIKYGGIKETFTLYVFEAFMIAVLVSIGTALFKGMALKKVMEGVVNGCKGVTLGAIILGLAVTLKGVTQHLGTAEYLIRTTSEVLVPWLLPALYLGLAMFMAFATGTSWGTYAVIFPIAMPLAWAINPDPHFLTLCFAAVLGGAVYGDNCSPISDTTILSSLVCGADHMDHVTTQIPLATVAAVISAIFYTSITLFKVPLFVIYLVIIFGTALMIILSKSKNQDLNIEQKNP
ncbi:Na+/H+ antiporter NhaC family protein [Acidobacteriota bacterium]